MTRPIRAAWFLLVLFSCWGSSTALAQVVRGTVTDRTTDKPVAKGSVVLLLARRGIAESETDVNGHFELVAPGPGRYRIQFEAPGYRLVITPLFEVRAGESIDVPFTTSALAPVALDTAIVEGKPVPRYLEDFYQRKARGFGEFVLRDDFERYNPSVVSDILHHTRSFDITYNANAAAAGEGIGAPGSFLTPQDSRTVVISGRRGIRFGNQSQCPPLIFVDGTYVGNAKDADIDAIVAVGSIEAMELYQGGVEVPVEFARTGSQCGVMAIWSRRTGGEAGPTVHHIEIGSQLGGRLASNGLQSGRAGMQGTIGLIGRVEGHLAFNVYLTGLHGAAVPRSGWEITLALRVRPFGSTTPWYVGGGVTSLNLSDAGSSQFSSDLTQEHQVLLTGVSLPVSWLRPLLELQLLDPFESSQHQVQAFTGFTVRLQ